MPDKGANTGAATSEAGTPPPAGTTTSAAADTGKAAAGESTSTADSGKSGEKTEQQQTTGETGKGKETPGQKTGETPAPKAPEKYELKAPDALKGYADTTFIAEVEAYARANNLPNEDAQQILEDVLATTARKAAAYETATKADPDYGGDKFSETQKLARRAIDRIRPEGHARRDSFLSFLGREGAGNHIEVVSFLADLGKLMGEDSPSHARTGGQRGSSSGADASKLYDHPTSKAADAAG